MKFSELQKYKHDTIGKFQTLKSLIETLNEENLKCEESLEILEAADEVFSIMAKTSKEFLETIKL